MKHNLCGNIYEVLPTNFLSGNRCPKCSNNSRIKNKRKSNDKFLEDVYNLVGDEYTVLDTYINSSTKLHFKHNLCGNIYEVNPQKFLSGNRCPKCANDRRIKMHTKDSEKFIEEIHSMYNEEYTLLEPYIKRKIPILVRHNLCGKEFKKTPNSLLSGKGCPYCRQSKGELKIRNFLDTNDIKFESEKRFKECKDKRELPFDFYLEEYNLLIEYDGIQHFEESNFGYGSMTLDKTMYHDSIKNNFCKENNIRLLRISYKDFNNIEKILRKEVIEYEEETRS